MASEALHHEDDGDLNMKLMEAAGRGDLEEVRSLLARGASGSFIHDPPGTWGSCDTKGPLHQAIRAMPRRPRGGDGAHAAPAAPWKDLIGALIGAGADVNALCRQYDWRGCGCSQSAFEMALPHCLQDPDLLEVFLAAGADPNTQRRQDRHSMRTDGRSLEHVLHQVVGGGNLEVARALLDRGAEVDAVASERFSNERGFNRHTEETSLHRACGGAKADIAMCALLLARGADVNAVRKELEHEDSGQESTTDDPRDPEYESPVVCVPVRETALHRAILAKQADLVTMLVCAGADTAMERCRGGVKTPCRELCGGDASLLEALEAQWTPETHRLFPADVRSSVEAALMIARRQQWPLPDTVLFRVCALAAGT
eukprot:CAMPEP_0179230330 /NCGR_PEP_ID=MMETSP0797-20121207/10782_1 /TAXON_ID=47934 /ORGANISM="Dinophysis acuminata, Strain DAEP01" /LENGTH=370 /DNA_ID=CAMNT_0020937403 /DNA_START=92 /DNA_END=1204 /DNA_ORIENTATION=-